MLFNTAVTLLRWFGVVVFAVSGALVASRKRMDIVGFALLGVVTGVGGGLRRDGEGQTILGSGTENDVRAAMRAAVRMAERIMTRPFGPG